MKICMLIHPSLLVCITLVTEGWCPKAAVVSVLFTDYQLRTQ